MASSGIPTVGGVEAASTSTSRTCCSARRSPDIAQNTSTIPRSTPESGVNYGVNLTWLPTQLTTVTPDRRQRLPAHHQRGRLDQLPDHGRAAGRPRAAAQRADRRPRAATSATTSRTPTSRTTVRRGRQHHLSHQPALLGRCGLWLQHAELRRRGGTSSTATSSPSGCARNSELAGTDRDDPYSLVVQSEALWWKRSGLDAARRLRFGPGDARTMMDWFRHLRICVVLHGRPRADDGVLVIVAATPRTVAGGGGREAANPASQATVWAPATGSASRYSDTSTCRASSSWTARASSPCRWSARSRAAA